MDRDETLDLFAKVYELWVMEEVSLTGHEEDTLERLSATHDFSPNDLKFLERVFITHLKTFQEKT